MAGFYLIREHGHIANHALLPEDLSVLKILATLDRVSGLSRGLSYKICHVMEHSFYPTPQGPIPKVTIILHRVVTGDLSRHAIFISDGWKE